MNLTVLEDMGFSKREAKCYIALLETGSTTVGEVIKKTDIPSSKIYEVLERLMQKGLVSYVIKKHQKHFQAADPEIVLNFFNEKKKSFEAILPELKMKQHLAKHKQTVEFYQGKQALFKLLQSQVDSARKGDEYLSFSVGFQHDDPDISLFYTNLGWRRVEKGLKMKVLSNARVKHIYEKRYSKKLLAVIHNKYTDFYFPQGITLVNGKIIIINWEQYPSAIVITSDYLYKQYKQFFYELYKKGRK